MIPMLVDRGRRDESMVRHADELLDRVGLTAWRNRMVMNIPGGQQQRVAIARALAMNPDLVLADEPTGNLDSTSAVSVFQLLREIHRKRGTTSLIVTHNLDLALRCDRIIRGYRWITSTCRNLRSQER